MPIKSLLIPYNGGDASDAALHVALQMADKYDAHLTGMVAHSASSVTRSIPKWLSNSMQEAITEITGKRSEELRERFLEKTRGKIDQDRLHWIDIRSKPDHAVVWCSRIFDMTVLGQYENLLGADELILHPNRIAYNAGRPILVVPRNFSPEVIPERAVVAWDRKRMSSRALFDAMQMLESKEDVTVVTIDEPDLPSLDFGPTIETTLDRHGIKSEHLILDRGSKTKASLLLDVCKQKDAGILVMGAYERSKLAEDLFGGTTDDVLNAAHLPVFLSH